MEPRADHEQGAASPIGEQPRRFRRSSDRQLGGVAKGMADYVGIDPLFLRIGFVVLAFASGLGLFAYLAAWLLIPDDSDTDDRPLALTGHLPALVAGFGVLVLGSIALTSGFSLDLDVLVPVTMVVLGLWVLNQRRDPQTASVPFAGPAARGLASAPPADPHLTPPPPSPPPPPATPSPPAGEPVDPTTPLPSAAGVPPLPPAPGWAQLHPERPGSPASHEPPGPPIVSITMAAAVVVIGALLVMRNLGGVDVDAGLYLGGVLAVVGAGIVVSAFTRRALVLFPLAAVLTILLAVAPLIDTTATGGVGARDLRVTEADLESSYTLGAGELRVDFRDLELTADRRVEVAVGAGYAEIRLPGDLPVRVEATSRFGYVEVLGVVEEGVGSTVTVVDGPDDPQGGTLTLVPSVTFGYVEVSRG